MADHTELIQAIAPDVENQQVTEVVDEEAESEDSETEFEILSAKVDNLASMMVQFFPLLQGLSLQKTNEKKKSNKVKPVETPKKLPWDQRGRDPTFTEMAGSMVFSSNESSPKDFKRRETIFNQADIIERNAQAPSYRKNIPPFKGELKSTRFSEVSKFFKDLNAYQSEHNTTERGAPHITWSVRVLLTPSGVGDEAFTQIPNRDLFALIREYIKPTSQGEFRSLFIQDLRFFVKDNFLLSNATYREWVAMVRIYFSEVLLRYDFLAEGLDPRLIPNVEDRETGLVSLILSKMMPFDTAKRMNNEFFYEFKKRNRNYTLTDWVTAFQIHAEGYVQYAKDSLALEEAISPKGKDPASSSVYARKFDYTPKRFTENYSHHNNSETKTVLFVENGNGDIENNSESHDDKDSYPGDIPNPNVEEIDLESGNLKIDEISGSHDDHRELLAFVADTKQPLKPMHKIAPPSMGSGGRIFAPGERRTKSEFPCMRFVLDGKCPYNENCNNSHDEGRCKEYYFQVIKKLQNESPFRPAPQSKQQVLVLQEQQRSYVMSLSQNVDLVKVVFCTGMVRLKDSSIDVFKMLLDSGALHGNYISEEFLYEHNTKLFHIMEDIDELVILADASKTCNITKRIRLVLTVNSGLEGIKDVTFSSYYSVLPGLRHDIIVGLPSLLCELIDLYVARILSAKTMQPSSLVSSEPVHSISTVTKAKPPPKSKKIKGDKSTNVTSSSSPKKRGPFLHDSINRGEGLRKKFIAHGDNKPQYPDGDSDDNFDEDLLDETLPLAHRLKKSKRPKTVKALKVTIPQIAASKLSTIELTKDIFGSESDEFLNVHSPQSSSSFHRADSVEEDRSAVVTDLVTPDSNEETHPSILSVIPYPRVYPFMRVPFTDCNDFREREVGFKLRLEEFRVFLSQTDHTKGSCWNRTEPITLALKSMLQECVHSEGTYCAVSTMVNLDEQYPNHSVGWDTIREFQYACTECRVKRWYMPLSRHRAHDCPYLQHDQLGTIYNVVSWSGVMGPPSLEHIQSEAISNLGLYMRCQLDKDPNTWMYWVRDPQSAFYYGAKSVEYREKEAREFQDDLTYEDVTPMNLTTTMYNPMLTETPIYKMNEAKYSRIALAHAEVGCSTDILPTILKLDVYFPGHTITFDDVLQFLRACSRCTLQCDHFVERGYGHPYVDQDIAQRYGPTGHYTGKLPTVPETDENKAHYLHMIYSTTSKTSGSGSIQDIEVPMTASQHDSLWYDQVPFPRHHDCGYINTSGTTAKEVVGLLATEFERGVVVKDNLEDVRVNDMLEPWSTDLHDEEAPEEAETPSPSSFDIPLTYMNQTIAEATLDFYKMIETRVSTSMTEFTNVVEMLKNKYLPVFVPHNWTGITGIDPIVIEVTGDLPPYKKPRARPINPKLMTKAHGEFQRLLGYFYAPSTSPWASCLVIAPKKTEPLIRFCGDYREMNKFICARHTPIPNVGNEILRISSFKIFADLDMKTSFHQLPLAVESRRLLSIQTIWGQVEPIFVPEGSKPASGALQDFVRLLFGHLDYVIAIFDNLLVLANDPGDLELKLYNVLDICLSHNVVLGFKKCNIGVTEVEFFGYICSHGEYKLSDARKASIMSLPFPKSQKEVQQVMGTANMFLRFTPGYATLAKDITDMSSKVFNWDESTWIVDHRASFERFKVAISNSLTLYYPNYELNWILRTDASTTGCGVVLYQEYIAPGGIIQEQVIAVLSHKFSGAATRWPTIEQEAYAIFFGVQKLEYLLMCKSFVVETDHRNLVWMETSLVAKIIRWRIYLQAFDMTIKHIKGTDNGTADWLSRLHHIDVSDHTDVTLPIKSDGIETCDSTLAMYTPRQCFDRVHGGRMGHPGTVRTIKLLAKYFPSHGMSQETVANLVSDCPHCQKIRIGLDSQLVPMHRTISQGHLRAAIGCDTLSVSPTDDAGYRYIIVVVNLFSKYVVLYPVRNHDAISLATALFQYFCTYGICERIVTDPGSDLTSAVVRHLHRFFGIRHVFSVVERHQSNGVEGTNKSILRHLRSIVHDERLIKQWSSPTVLPLIQYMLNCEHESSESGVLPLHAQFGNLDAVYQQLPLSLDPAHLHHEFVQTLAENITMVRAIAQEHQAKLAKERAADLPEAQRTTFQPGDFVLKRLEHRPSKLMFQLSGPYKVISQNKNDVQVRSLVYDNILTFNLDHLKVFIGSESEAKAMAMLDKNQYLIKEVQAYRGDPATRSTCSFLVWFEDNDIIWLPYSLDISNTAQFEIFCSTRPELYTLLYTQLEAQKMIAALNRSPICEVKPGDSVYVDLRFYGAGWYNSLELPSSDSIRYVVLFTYIKWYHKTSYTKIVAQCVLFNEEWPVNHHFVRAYGSCKLPPEGSVIVDSELVNRFPHILPPMAK